jgi:hypothetical protein
MAFYPDGVLVLARGFAITSARVECMRPKSTPRETVVTPEVKVRCNSKEPALRYKAA